MRIDLDFLKSFINVDIPQDEVKELLASLGIEVAEIHESNDSTAFTVEITPNRPDWLSHLGIAREIHARLPGTPLNLPDFKDPGTSVGEAGEAVEIEIESAADCGRYTGCIVNDVEPKSSPISTQRLFNSLDLRPINHVVDASNHVLMAMGHPIHMFDLDLLEGRRIVVRRARPGERLRLLDEREVELETEDLVIADAQRPVALAGIMGGAASGVTSSTRRVFIESAWFDPVRVRRTARRLGLQTDASYRFERGADITATPRALAMALDLIRAWSGKPLNASGYRDVYPAPSKPVEVELPADFPSQYTGIAISHQDAAGILQRLQFKVDTTDPGLWRVSVPGFRVDIACKQDLVEEIVRIYGYDRIPATMPRTVNPVFNPAPMRNLRLKLARHLVAKGYHQTLHYSFHALEDNLAMAEKGAVAEDFIALRNPLGRDYAIMRNSLIPGLLRATVLNANQGAPLVKLFETGKRFWVSSGRDFHEEETLAVTAWGEHVPVSWRNSKPAEMDFFVFRAEMETLLHRIIPEFSLEQTELPWLRKGCAFSIRVEDRILGWMGYLDEKLTRSAGLDTALPALEMGLDSLTLERRIEHFRPWNRLPMVKRDLSVFIPGGVVYADLEKAINLYRPDELESYHLFDYYMDKGETGSVKISLAMSFCYRHPERTLTGEEVNRMHAELTESLVKALKLEPRA